MPHPYTPLSPSLNQIRLLHLKPATRKENEISCSFSVISLDDHSVQYEALSYVWGTSMYERSVQLDGVPWTVTTNLYHALTHLRLVDRERIIWVDALCIDQSNVEERSEQVSRMYAIYGQTAHVVIWLGAAFPGIELAADFFNRLGSDMNLHIHAGQAPSLILGDYDITSLELLKALKTFLTLPWWTRIWTVQEWVLARSPTFLCGQYLLDTENVIRCVRNFLRHAQSCCVELDNSIASLLNNQFAGIETIDRIRGSLHRKDFTYILGLFRNRQATDRRDKVYGILGLADSQYASSVIKVDYTLTADRVFELTAVSLIEHTKNLDVLSHIWPKGWIKGQRNYNLPSFVPDWAIPDLQMPLDSGGVSISQAWSGWLANLKDYNAKGGHVAADVFSRPGNLLAKGVIVDTVEAVGSRHPKPGCYGEYIDEMFELADIIKNADEPYPTQGARSMSRKEAFWLTVCGGQEGYNDPARNNSLSSRRKYSMSTEDFSTVQKWNRWARLEPLPPPSDADVVISENRFSIVSYGRRFMVTKDKRMGFVPWTAEPGDAIAVLAGGSVPIILGPKADGWIVLGDAYVHGIMDGEAVSEGKRMEYLKFY